MLAALPFVAFAFGGADLLSDGLLENNPQGAQQSSTGAGFLGASGGLFTIGSQMSSSEMSFMPGALSLVDSLSALPEGLLSGLWNSPGGTFATPPDSSGFTSGVFPMGNSFSNESSSPENQNGSNGSTSTITFGSGFGGSSPGGSPPGSGNNKNNNNTQGNSGNADPVANVACETAPMSEECGWTEWQETSFAPPETSFSSTDEMNWTEESMGWMPLDLASSEAEPQVTAAPEPSSLLLMGSGLVGLVWLARTKLRRG